MSLRETPSKPELQERQSGVGRHISELMRRIRFEIRMFTNGGIVRPEEAPHPDFRKRLKVNEDLTWYQNRDWGPVPDPEFKVGFYIKDPRELDGCPWVCKVGNNLNPRYPDHPYFCVAYGDPSRLNDAFGLEDMRQWAMHFDHPSLMKYDGTLLIMLKE